jgi:capsid protein
MIHSAAYNDVDTLRFLKSLESPEPQKRRRNKAANFFDGFGERAQSGFGGGLHGGQVDRTNENWRPGGIGPNQLFQNNGQLLRERAWDLYLNNPFAKSVIGAIIANVIECGITPERDDNWEKVWNRWGGLTPHSTRHCDLSRDETIYGLQRTWLLEVIVGGGCLAHFVTMNRRSQEVPFSIELITEERFADHVQSFGRNPKTANKVKNAIEIDQATGRTLAYHIRKALPNDMEFDPEATIRIPVERAHYGFMKWRRNAKRGTSLLRACVQWLFALGYYVDNELTASDIKSTFAAMIKTDKDSDLGWADLIDSDNASTTDINGRQRS